MDDDHDVLEKPFEWVPTFNADQSRFIGTIRPALFKRS